MKNVPAVRGSGNDARPGPGSGYNGRTSTTNANYVDPSARMTIKPGMKIDHLFIRNLKQPYILQHLTDRGYYVGETGVLLFDALEGRGEQLLAAIREVTPLPVTTIV
jgi:hypothetical protein